MSSSAGQRALQGLAGCNIGSRRGAFTACLRQADGRVAHKHKAWHQAPHRQASQQLLGSSMLDQTSLQLALTMCASHDLSHRPLKHS